LASNGVTVVSGLARGVDTQAHTAALAAGGRTIAVIGTGITRCYPAENQGLANTIAGHGAVVSQFWPTRPPGRDTFPRRNRVTSGMSIGTAVIEASSTSGAKMQARLAYEHGKHVWLLASLVTSQPWAQKMVALGRARPVRDTTDILADLVAPSVTAATAVQDTLDLR
jgi:DNA processing protein